MGGFIDVNVSMFWGTWVKFRKSVVLQLFSKYNQSYDNLNVRSRPKFNSPLKINKLFQCFSFRYNLQQLYKEIFRMALVNSVTFVVLKILEYLFYMQSSINATNFCHKRNFEKNCPKWPYFCFKCYFKI